MKKNRFREDLDKYGDMLNKEIDGLQGSPDSILAKIIEYGLDGAAIKGSASNRVPLFSYAIDPGALRIAKCIFDMPMRSKNAIVAKIVRRDLRTDRQRAKICECQEPTYRQRLSRGIRDLKQRYLHMSQSGL
jgi:hypothetical protein